MTPFDVAMISADKRLWREIVPRLVEVGVVDRVDRTALEGLCTLYARACQAGRAVAFEGHFARGSKGQIRDHPGGADRTATPGRFHRMSKSFTLTPVARARLGLAQLGFRRSLDAEFEREVGKADFTPVD